MHKCSIWCCMCADYIYDHENSVMLNFYLYTKNTYTTVLHVYTVLYTFVIVIVRASIVMKWLYCVLHTILPSNTPTLTLQLPPPVYSLAYCHVTFSHFNLSFRIIFCFLPLLFFVFLKITLISLISVLQKNYFNLDFRLLTLLSEVFVLNWSQNNAK